MFWTQGLWWCLLSIFSLHNFERHGQHHFRPMAENRRWLILRQRWRSSALGGSGHRTGCDRCQPQGLGLLRVGMDDPEWMEGLFGQDSWVWASCSDIAWERRPRRERPYGVHSFPPQRWLSASQADPGMWQNISSHVHTGMHHPSRSCIDRWSTQTTRLGPARWEPVDFEGCWRCSVRAPREPRQGQSQRSWSDGCLGPN